MRRRAEAPSWVAPVVGEGAVVAVVQLAPIALLPVHHYARYSGVYLIYAATLAFTLAILCDVWARSVRRDDTALGDRDRYYAVLTAMALLAALPAAVVAAIVGLNVLGVGVAAVASTLAVFRAGSRYYLIAAGSGGRAGIADLTAALSGTLAGAILWWTGHYSLHAALTVWALVNAIAIGGARSSPRISIYDVGSWFSQHRRTILALLSEAGLMNLASVGTPYAVAAVSGAPGLALHRASTSLAYPVRLVLGAVRSRILAGLLPRSAAVHAVVAASGLALGGALTTVLLVLQAIAAVPGTALELAGNHAPAVGALVAATTYSTYLQFEARGAMGPGTLVLRRGAHTVLIIGGTVLVAALGGLDGLLWGASAAVALSSILWMPSRHAEGNQRVMTSGAR